jgi:hypothetical protein
MPTHQFCVAPLVISVPCLNERFDVCSVQVARMTRMPSRSDQYSPDERVELQLFA